MLFERSLAVFRNGYENPRVDEAVRGPGLRISKIVFGPMYQNTTQTVRRGFIP